MTMDWVTENDPQEESSASRQGAETTTVVAHEISEDHARQEYDAALKFVQENNHFEAKVRFENLVTRDLPDTPFRARLFRAALKNLARCYAVLHSEGHALDALVRATSHLDRDDRDVSLWIMLRRVARDVRHVPMFKLADAVLAEVLQPHDYVRLPFPEDCQQVSETLSNDVRFPNKVRVVIRDLNSLTWIDLIQCLTSVLNDEAVTLEVVRPAFPAAPLAAEDLTMSLSNYRDQEIVEADEVVPMDVEPSITAAPADAGAAAVEPLTVEEEITPKRKRREKSKADTYRQPTRKRQALLAGEVAGEDLQQVATAEEQEEEITLEDLLPTVDPSVAEQLYSWFDSRSSETGFSESAQSPVNSPTNEKLLTTSEERETRFLRTEVLDRAIGGMNGYTLIRTVYRTVCEGSLSVSCSTLCQLYKMMVSRGIEMNDSERWLGLLSLLEQENSFEHLTPTQIMEQDGDLQNEMYVLECALNCSLDEYELASRTLKRCAGRARAMKRPLLAELALARLAEFNNPDDYEFIAYERSRLLKSSSHERIDIALDEYGVHSTNFAKSVDNCLQRVFSVCSQENRIEFFARYRMDVLRHGLVKRSEAICRTALFHFFQIDDGSSLKETDSCRVVDESTAISKEEVEQVCCRLARLYPSLLSRLGVESASSTDDQHQLWPKLISAFWVWTSMFGPDHPKSASLSAIEALKTFAAERDYSQITALEEKICLIKAMVSLGAYRNALSVWKTLPKFTPTLAEWVTRRIEFCEFCVKRDSTCADLAMDMLLHDQEMNAYFRDDLPRVVISSPRMPNDGKEQSDDDESDVDPEEERRELQAYREEVLMQCAEIRWLGPMFTVEDVPLLWEFLAPHLWISKKAPSPSSSMAKKNLIVKPEQKRLFLEKMLPFVSVAPATEQISQIEAGGFWFHFARSQQNKKDEGEGGSSKEVEETAGGLGGLENWFERDLKAEPHRLSTLLMIGKIKYEAYKTLEDSFRQWKSDDSEQKRQKKALLDECLGYLQEIEKLVERRNPLVGIKPGALVEVRTTLCSTGEIQEKTAIVARLHESSSADVLLADEQEVQREVPIEKLTKVDRSLLGDILPSELDTFLVDVHEYLALVRYFLNDQELDAGLEACIGICERIRDPRTWSFYWFLGCVAGKEDTSRRAFDKAYALANDLLQTTQRKKNLPKKTSIVLYSQKMAVSETITRICDCKLKDSVGQADEDDVKQLCLAKLKEANHLDQYNLHASRLIQDLAGPEDDTLENGLKLYLRGTWRTTFFLFDEMCNKEREDEIRKTVLCRLNAIKARANPIPGLLVLLEHDRLKKIDKCHQDLYQVILHDILPGLGLENVYLLSLVMARITGARKRLDQMLIELGKAEFKLEALPDIVEACKSRWRSIHDQHANKASRLVKPTIVAIRAPPVAAPVAKAEAVAAGPSAEEARLAAEQGALKMEEQGATFDNVGDEDDNMDVT